LGAALGTMVANLSAHKRGWDERWEEFSDQAVRGRSSVEELIRLVDEDTRAFNGIMAAFKLPQGTDAERAERDRAIQEATKKAMEVPLDIAEKALASMEMLKEMAETGNPASVSDAGVGALCARAAVRGAALNVRINSSGLEDKTKVDEYLRRAEEAVSRAESLEKEILGIVEDKL
jgi:glutamate formiminotransferase/formiminotetrahydrofolate cyclodeaminase